MNAPLKKTDEDAKLPTKTEIIAAELEMMAKRGIISPQKVLEAARKPSHPLHAFFTWDDAEAAEKHRIEEAMRMIRVWKQIRTFKADKDHEPVQVKVRALLPSFRKPNEYLPRAVVLDRAKERQAFIDQRLEALRGWCRSVSDVSELTELRETIERKLEKIATG